VRARRQVIVRAGTFINAVQKMQRALYEFHVRGVKARAHCAWRRARGQRRAEPDERR